jgi:WhiB family redox-sensing transcriptional regulator
MYPIIQLPVPDESPTAVRSAAPRCADGNGTLTPLFFSDDVIDIARAKAICGKCALAASCLQDAIAREEPWGVWGGELLLNGRIVTNKRPCGRPPKVPRPELVVDELGVVGSVA